MPGLQSIGDFEVMRRCQAELFSVKLGLLRQRVDLKERGGRKASGTKTEPSRFLDVLSSLYSIVHLFDPPGL